MGNDCGKIERIDRNKSKDTSHKTVKRQVDHCRNSSIESWIIGKSHIGKVSDMYTLVDSLYESMI